MQQAYEQRTNLVINKLTPEHPQQSYEVDLPVGAKITLVHERRVGYGDDYAPWKLSHISLEVVDAKTHQIIHLDDSAQDTVHQVANCKRDKNERHCSEKTTLIHAIVNVKLLSKTIDGNAEEPFALVMSVPFKTYNNAESPNENVF
jgi:serine protease AprX